MLSFLWPTKRKPEPTLLGRLGRVTHWSLVVCAILFFMMSWSSFTASSNLETSLGIYNSDGTKSSDDPKELASWHWDQGFKSMLWGFGAFFGGRICRYVLSAE